MKYIGHAIHAMRKVTINEDQLQRLGKSWQDFVLNESDMEAIRYAKCEMVRLIVSTRFEVAQVLGKYGHGLQAAGLGPDHQDTLAVVDHLHEHGSLAKLENIAVFKAFAWLVDYQFIATDEDNLGALQVAQSPECITWIRDFNPTQYKASQVAV